MKTYNIILYLKYGKLFTISELQLESLNCGLILVGYVERMEETSLKSRRDLLGEESLHGRVVLDDKEITVCHEFIKFTIRF